MLGGGGWGIVQVHTRVDFNRKAEFTEPYTRNSHAFITLFCLRVCRCSTNEHNQIHKTEYRSLFGFAPTRQSPRRRFSASNRDRIHSGNNDNNHNSNDINNNNNNNYRSIVRRKMATITSDDETFAERIESTTTK